MKTTHKNTWLALVLMVLPLVGKAQVSNLDFEIWDHPVTEAQFSNLPTAWLMLAPGNTEPSSLDIFYAPPTTDAQNGDYALTVCNWYNYMKDVAIQIGAYNTRLSVVRGFYKYTENSLLGNTDNVIDTAQVAVYMTRWNSATSKRDTVGTGIANLSAATNYTPFTSTITYLNATVLPDSVRILIDPSMLRRGTESFIVQNGFGSFLTIDNLSLADEQTAGLEEQEPAFRLYPNPVADLLYIDGFSGMVEVFDVNGRQVQTTSLQTNEVFVAEHLQTGIYMLQLSDGKHLTRTRIVKK